MNTPIYDALKTELWCKEMDAEYAVRRAGQNTPPLTLAQYVANGLGVPLITPNPVDSPARKPWTIAPPEDVPSLIVKSKPEPKWRTFLRCLLWWLP